MLPLGVWKVAAGLAAAGGLMLVGGDGPKPAAPPAPAPAAKPAEEAMGPTPAERLAELKAEFNAAIRALVKPRKDPVTGEVIGNAADREGGKALPGRFPPQLLELGESADEDTAAAALAFAVVRFGGLPPGQAGDVDKAQRRLHERFIHSPRLAAVAREMETVFGNTSRVEAMLTWATDHTARGRLEFQLAAAGDPITGRLMGEATDNVNLRRELTAARYRRIVEKYADVDGGKLAQQAERRLAALAPPRHLIVGKPAPATAGPDLDGKPMSLADYKGRVVVLEFWGSWCGPCVQATPGLKWVAEKYADKGVVVLGVMSETTPEAARKAAADLGVPWRNWFDLRGDDRSPLVAAWDVRRFPTTVVLDRAGVIRAVDPGGREALAEAVDAALARP